MAIEKVIDIKVNTNIQEASKKVDGLKTSVEGAKTSVKGFKDETEKISTSGLDKLGGSLSGLSPAFRNGIAGAKQLGSQLLLLAANPIGAVILAVVGGLTLLFKAFTSTKDGADQLRQVMAGLSSVVDVLRDRILNVGSAIIKFFSGDFKGALNEGRIAVSGFGNEVASEFKKAANATKDLQQVEDAFNSLSVSRAKVNRDLAISKELLTDENATYEQKKKALDLIKTTESKQTEQELANAKRKYEAIKALNALSDTSREDKKKEQDAEAALFSLQEQSARDRRAINKQEKTLLNQKVSDEKEAAAAIKTLNDERKAKAKEAYEADKTALTEKLKEEGLNFQQRRDLIKADLLLTAKDRKKFNDEVNKEEIKSIDDHNKSIAELNKRYDEEKENRLADTAVKKEELDYTRKVKEIESLAKTELEKQTLIEKLDAEHKERMGVAFKTDQLKKEEEAKAAAQREKDLDIAIQDAKRAALDTGLNILMQFAGKNKAVALSILTIQKGLAIADVVVGAAKSIGVATSALTAANIGALATPQAIATSGASAAPVIKANTALYAKGVLLTKLTAGTSIASILAAGIGQAASITSGGGGAAGGGDSGGAGGGAGATAPQFNVVGSTGVNQLAGVLGNNQPAPVQAYVVANNVTTAQSLDRNIISSATLGG